jgi:hypothetical protein
MRKEQLVRSAILNNLVYNGVLIVFLLTWSVFYSMHDLLTEINSFFKFNFQFEYKSIFAHATQRTYFRFRIAIHTAYCA